MRIAALGRTRALLDAIRKLASAGHQVVLIATSSASPEYGVDEYDFKALAAQLDCEFIADGRLGSPENSAKLDRAGADVAISINWKSLIPASLIRRFPHGIVNAHAGDLPRYRGNAIPNWIILRGEETFVITLHFMDDGLDSGPVVLKRKFAVTPRTYVGDLYDLIYEQTPDMFVEAIGLIAADPDFSGDPQPHGLEHALRCFSRRPEDGLIHWDSDADRIVRLVRASSRPFKGAFTHFDRRLLTVWRARCETLPYEMVGVPGQIIDVRKSGDVAVLAYNGLVVLEEVELQGGADGGRPAMAIRSTRSRLGLDLLAELELFRNMSKANPGA